jgi:hypothetical protein
MLAVGSAATSPETRTTFPPRLDRYVTETVKLSGDERQQLVDGKPVTRMLDVETDAEIAVFGAVWIDAPVRRYVEAVKDIERFERGGGFKVTRRIGRPPQMKDFADLRLPDKDVEDLRTCNVGDCEVKLGAGAIERFRTEIDWRAPTATASANTLMQKLALQYVVGYLEGGNERLAVYRDGARATAVGEEFRAMTDQMPELTTDMARVHRYLLDYPKVSLPDATSILYWQEASFGLKPTIRISHLTIREGPEDALVVSQMLYATHYFRTGLEMRALVPDSSRGNGFWLVTVNRSRSDGFDGAGGGVIRRRVKREVQDATVAALQATKQKFAPSH